MKNIINILKVKNQENEKHCAIIPETNRIRSVVFVLETTRIVSKLVCYVHPLLGE